MFSICLSEIRNILVYFLWEHRAPEFYSFRKKENQKSIALQWNTIHLLQWPAQCDLDHNQYVISVGRPFNVYFSTHSLEPSSASSTELQRQPAPLKLWYEEHVLSAVFLAELFLARMHSPNPFLVQLHGEGEAAVSGSVAHSDIATKRDALTTASLNKNRVISSP